MKALFLPIFPRRIKGLWHLIRNSTEEIQRQKFKNVMRRENIVSPNSCYCFMSHSNNRHKFLTRGISNRFSGLNGAFRWFNLKGVGEWTRATRRTSCFQAKKQTTGVFNYFNYSLQTGIFENFWWFRIALDYTWSIFIGFAIITDFEHASSKIWRLPHL